MEKYYLVIEGTQHGPFTIEDLKEKGIAQTTLVWTEKMVNWTEAKNVEALKDIVKKSPPPIPKAEERQLLVQAEISKKKEKLITSATEVVVARETKSVFQQIFYGLIIAAISFPIFYFGVYKANKYDNFDVHKEVQFSGGGSYNGSSDNTTMSGIDITDFPFTWYGMDYQTVTNNIELRKEIYTKKSAYSALITFLIASGGLILIRYVSKGTQWVQEASNKET